MVFKKSCVVLALIAVASASSTQKSFKLSEDVEVINNGYQNENEARGEQSIEDTVEKYIQSHDVTFKLPLDTAATVSAKDLNNGVMNFKLKFSSSDVDEGRGKKKKIKKVLIPIAVLLLLKAIALIPLILGVLGIKTWNALQLSFVTFLSSFGMAIYELLKKFASDHPPAVVTTHIAHDHHDHHHDYHHDFHHDHHDYHWDHHRSANEAPQQVAYKGYY